MDAYLEYAASCWIYEVGYSRRKTEHDDATDAEFFDQSIAVEPFSKPHQPSVNAMDLTHRYPRHLNINFRKLDVSAPHPSAMNNSQSIYPFHVIHPTESESGEDPASLQR
jgi:hypothetical protein